MTLKLSLIPTMEYAPFVDESGKMTPLWNRNLAQLYRQLNETISRNGLKVPQLTATEITPDLAIAIGNGVFVYDSTNDLMKVTIGGAFKTVTTS